jgi:hypothetical protein
MLRALEELESELARQRDSLEYRQTESRFNSVRAAEFSNQMRTVEARLVRMLSDSAEAAKHARRGRSRRMPGSTPGVDPDSAEQRHLEIESQRQHLRAEIEQLRHASNRFSRQAREHDEEARTIRQTMAEIQDQIKRLKKEIEKARQQERRDNKRGGGPRGGGSGGGPSQPHGSYDPYYDGGWSEGNYDTYLSGGGNGQQGSSYSSTQNQAAVKAAGHHTSHRTLKTKKTSHTKR